MDELIAFLPFGAVMLPTALLAPWLRTRPYAQLPALAFLPVIGGLVSFGMGGFLRAAALDPARHRCGVPRAWERHRCGQHVVGIPAPIDRLEVQEALGDQARADQERHRDGQFRHDQQPARMPPSGNGIPHSAQPKVVWVGTSVPGTMASYAT